MRLTNKLQEILHNNSFLYKKAVNLKRLGNFIKVTKNRGRKKPFLNLKIDLNNSCNLRCKFCYTLDMPQTKSIFMSKEQFKELADTLFPYAQQVSLSCAWEPLMNKHFKDFLAESAKYQIPYLFFVTNGMLLTDEVIEQTIQTPVHEMAISIDGSSKELFEEIRVRGDFDRIINNLKRIKEIKEKNNSVYPKVRINYTVFKENAHEAPEFIDKYSDYFDGFYLHHLLLMRRNDVCEYQRLELPEFQKVMEACSRKCSDKKKRFLVSFNHKYDNVWYCPNAQNFLQISSQGDIKICNQNIWGNFFEMGSEQVLERLLRSDDPLIKPPTDSFCKNKCHT